jgi:hypothetical protein
MLSTLKTQADRHFCIPYHPFKPSEVFMSNTNQVPDCMSEEDARRFIDTNTPRFNKLRENVVAIKTRADEARLKINELLDTAQQKLGTRDEAEIQRIFDERRLANGTRAQTWISGIEACEAELATLSRAAQPGR